MLDPSRDLAGGTTPRFCTEGEGCGLPLVLLSAASHPCEKHLCISPLSQPDAGGVWQAHFCIYLFWPVQARSHSTLSSMLDKLVIVQVWGGKGDRRKQYKFCIIWVFSCCCGGHGLHKVALCSTFFLCRDLWDGGKMLRVLRRLKRQQQKCCFGSISGQILKVLLLQNEK